MIGFKMNRWIACAFSLMLMAGLSTSAFAVKRKNIKSGFTGPSQEEFYSTAAKNISQADRKRADRLRVRTIVSIKSLLKSKKIKGARRFELRLRLGELYAERHDFIRDLESHEYSAKHDRWIANRKKGKEPRLSSKKSRTQLANAANAFRKLVREFPKHRRTAAALYALGKTLARLGDDSSFLYFNKLVKHHKQSPLLPDAYLSMGEYYFEKHNISKAISSYRSVLKYKRHVAYPYAVYKLGWAYFNATPKNDREQRKNTAKAVVSFKLVIRLADADKRHNTKRMNLRHEAINDLIMVWSETEDTRTAWRYFKTIGEKDSFYKLLARLGSIYEDQGRNTKAIEVYARLIKENPARDDSPQIHEKLVSLYEKVSKPSLVVKTLSDMNKTYLKRGAWASRHRTNKSMLKDGEKVVEFNMHRMSTLYHRRSHKLKSPGLAKSATVLYAMYLSSFPKASNAYEIRYYYSELLFDSKRYEKSSMNYMVVAKQNPKGKYHKLAALNSVVTMKKFEAQGKYAKLPPAGQVPQPIKIPANKIKLMKVYEEYVKLLPRQKEGHPMMFSIAQTYFSYGHYDEGIKRFEKIIDKLPGTNQARSSAQIILGFQMERKEWAKAVLLSRKFIKNKGLKNKKLTIHLVAMLRRALYSQSLELEKAKKYGAAANSFMAYQKEFSWDKKSADKALNNASVNYYKAGMLEDAIAANRMLIEKYPKSSLKKQAIANVAQTYEALAQFGKAAHYYKKFAYDFPKEKMASKSLFNAAALYRGLSDIKMTETLLERYVRMYPYNRMHSDVTMQLGEVQEEQKKFNSAIATYKKLVGKTKNVDQKLLAGAKQAILTYKNKSPKAGRRLLNGVRRQLSRKNAPAATEARRLIAEVMFKEIDPMFLNYNRIKILSAKGLERAVKKKQGRLIRLARSYEEVIAVGSSEYSVASLYRLGEMHENFAENLFNAPSPAGASQVEVSAFRSSVDKVAFPLKEQAYKFYESAFKRSQEVETFTVWTRRTYDKMVDLEPKKHPKVDEQSANPTYMVHKVDLEPAVAILAH